MMVAVMAILVVGFIYSVYEIFVATDAKILGASLLRASLALLGFVAIRFNASIVLTAAVLLFALVSVLVLAIVRNEVQINHD